MSGINKVMLIGFVGRDPEVRYTQGGAAVAHFSLATSEIFGREADRQEKTEWHHVVCWGRLAEIAGQYVKKGRQVYIEGRIETRNWVNPQGVKHYKTEIIARNLQLLGRKDDDSDDKPAAASNDYSDFDIGDLGPPLDMDDNPLSPGD